jgi:adenylate kinase
MPENAPRSLPVIVITGTPGTGKTTHAQLLVQHSPVPLQHVNVSELVKEKMLHDGFDEEWQTYIVDEDKVCLCQCRYRPVAGAHVRSYTKCFRL